MEPLENGCKLTTTELAQLFDVAKKTIQMWVTKGLPHEKGGEGLPNTFNSVDVLQWWLGYKTGTDLQSEKTRLTKEQADKIEIDNAVRRSELLRVSDVEKFLTGYVLSARAKILLIPSRLEIEVPGSHDLAESIVGEILEELARAGTYEHSGEGEQEVETTPEAIGERVG